MRELQELITATQAYFASDFQAGSRNPPTSFAAFASDALGRLSSSVTPQMCLDYFRSHPKCQQTYEGRKFSSEDYTLFRTDDFALDVYFWLKQDTSIHDHSFHGAFRVLEGQNLQIDFDFQDCEEAKSTGVKSWTFGNLKLRDRRLQAPGTFQKIEHGAGFIHQVIHMTPVVVTLCLRTIRTDSKPAHLYFYPELRVQTSRFVSELPSDVFESSEPSSWYEKLKTEKGMDGPRLERALRSHHAYVSSIQKLKG